ncbi:unnamed protein product [Caretta caretta]
MQAVSNPMSQVSGETAAPMQLTARAKIGIWVPSTKAQVILGHRLDALGLKRGAESKMTAWCLMDGEEGTGTMVLEADVEGRLSEGWGEDQEPSVASVEFGVLAGHPHGDTGKRLDWMKGDGLSAWVDLRFAGTKRAGTAKQLVGRWGGYKT